MSGMMLIHALAAALGQLPGWLQELLRASLQASLLAVLLLAAGPMLRRRVAARWRYVLWMLVVLRFAPLPAIESRWNFLDLRWGATGDGTAAESQAAEAAPAISAPGRDAIARDVERADSNRAAVVTGVPDFIAPLLASSAVGDGLPMAKPTRAAAPLETSAGSATSIRVVAGAAAPSRAPVAPAAPLAAETVETGSIGIHIASVQSAASPVVAAGPGTMVKPRATESAAISWGAVVAAIYLVGAAVVAMRFAAAAAALARIVRRATPVTDERSTRIMVVACRALGLRRPLAIGETGALTSPALAGMVRPRLLMPRGLVAALSDEELRLVFLHEAAHHRRRDVAGNYALALLAAVHWFNPLVWVIAPRIRAEREAACDELVLRHGEASRYGETLLKLFECAMPARRLLPAVGVLETGATFSRRIRMIAAFRQRSGNGGAAGWAAVMVLAAAGAATLTVPLSQQATAATPPATPGGTAAARSGRTPASPSVPPTPAARPSSTPGANSNVDNSLQGDSEVNAKVIKALGENFKQLQTEMQPLDKVLRYFADTTHCNVEVNWRAVEAAGLNRNSPVDVNLTDVPARKVLRAILSNTAQTGQLEFIVDDGVITISTRDDLDSRVVVKVYNVRDLLSMYHRQGAGGELIKLIVGTVRPDLWRDNGGTAASIAEYNGIFTVTATPDMQAQLVELLEKMRAANQENRGPMPEPTPAADVTRSTGSVAALADTQATGPRMAIQRLQQEIANNQTLIQSLYAQSLALEQDRVVAAAHGGTKPEDMRALDAREDKIQQQMDALRKEISHEEQESIVQLSRATAVQVAPAADAAQNAALAKGVNVLQMALTTLDNYKKDLAADPKPNADKIKAVDAQIALVRKQIDEMQAAAPH